MSRVQVLECLASRVSAIRLAHPTRVAIDGIDASGKTHLAKELAALLAAQGREVITASLDGFHHPRQIRYRLGSLSPEGYYNDSFEYESLLSELLLPLGPGGNRRCRTRIHDIQTESPVQERYMQVPADAILLVDGIFLLRPELIDIWDFRIFVNIDFDTSLQRAMQRDLRLLGSVESVRQRYLERYIPAQRQYLERVNPQTLANVVVDNHLPLNPQMSFPTSQNSTKT
jgi:uridine kinase